MDSVFTSLMVGAPTQSLIFPRRQTLNMKMLYHNHLVAGYIHHNALLKKKSLYVHACIYTYINNCSINTIIVIVLFVKHGGV